MPHLHLLLLSLMAAAVTCVGIAAAPMPSQLLETAGAPTFQRWLHKHRRHLHTIPELSFEEHLTSAYLRQQLDALNISYTFPVATTGIVAHIGQGSAAVGLRADMDALPIDEGVEVDFKSTHPGKMHACGHDAHMTMLLGAARLLKEAEGQLPGRVQLLFQPAEEGRGGARVMIDEGATKGLSFMFGLHVWPGAPSGTIATKPGTIMAASTRFTVSIVGRGGHAAMPHLAADPVVAASAVVMELQPLVSRETSPTDGAVISVTRLNTGPGASNVIPDSVQLQGTLRALTDSTFQRLQRRVAEVITAAAEMRGCTATNLTWSATPYPPTVNDPVAAALAAQVAQQLVAAAAAGSGGSSNAGDDGVSAPSGAASAGAGRSGSSDNSTTTSSSSSSSGSSDSSIRYQELEEPSMAAEDFSFFGGHGGVPSAFVMLGTGNATLGTDVSLHNHMFQMDESQLHVGAALHASLAFEALRRVAGANGAVQQGSRGSSDGVVGDGAVSADDGCGGGDEEDSAAGMCRADPT